MKKKTVEALVPFMFTFASRSGFEDAVQGRMNFPHLA